MSFLGLGAKAEVRVELDRADVLPGDAVRVTVHVTPRRDLDLQEGRVELVYEHEHTYREREGADVRTTTKTDRKVVGRQLLVHPGTLDAGIPFEQTLELTIPPDAAPSAEGKITKLRWKVVATLAVPHARDAHGEAVVRVLSPAGVFEPAPPELYAWDRCELELRLDRTDFGPGDEIAGTLVASPLRECEVEAVRVELVRREEVSRKKGKAAVVKEAEATLDGAVELAAHLPREWPFRLSVPADPVPCLKTDHSSVTWRLIGVCARRMRPDYTLLQQVDVHTAPTRRT